MFALPNVVPAVLFQWRKRVEDLEQRESTELIRMRERFQEQLTRCVLVRHRKLGLRIGMRRAAEAVCHAMLQLRRDVKGLLSPGRLSCEE